MVGLRVHFVVKADSTHGWMSGVRRCEEPMVTLQVLASKIGHIEMLLTTGHGGANRNPHDSRG